MRFDTNRLDGQRTRPCWGCRRTLFVVLVAASLPVSVSSAKENGQRSKAAQAYLDLLENFAGYAEQHWNEKQESYDAAGAGVTWARGNGDVCFVNAVLLTEYPDREAFSPKKIHRDVLLDHVRRTLRTLCLTSNVCTDPRARKPGMPESWGGPDKTGRGGWHWQSGLETEHFVVAAKLLERQLDKDTLALVRQVAGAEADGAIRTIPSARKGDTAADDCSWNAGILGVVAAVYPDDPRAKKWDEWAKRWALNTESREPDHTSKRMIDGKPLGEWLVSVNAFPDLTIENHGFWDLPYQTSFADHNVAIVTHKICGRPVPEALYANAREEGDEILKWLVTPDGDLLCPQGIDWAERDVQHSWAFAELGTMLDQPWARAAEARCLELLTRRQKAFGDGSIHALDFGYQTDTARIWTASYLLHKYFPKPDTSPKFDEPRGAKIFPYVAAAVHRSPDLISSVTWFRSRQAVMVSPNNLDAVAGRPSFTRWDHESGTGWVVPKGERKHRAFEVDGEPRINQDGGALTVSFARQVPRVARQEIGYCALPSGVVVVFSRWRALGDVEIGELVDHPFRWVEIKDFITKPSVEQKPSNVWNIDGKLEMRVLGDVEGGIASDGVNGAVRRDFSAKEGDVLLDTVCVYQPIVAGRPPVRWNARETCFDWRRKIRRGRWRTLTLDSGK